VSTLLLEIGVEELPSSYVEAALAALPGLVEARLSVLRLAHGPIRALGTPRRLAVLVEDLAARQADLSEQVLGPPKAAAYAEDGTPKKAALGFARKLGVEVEALTLVETDKGVYVAGRREEPGRPAVEVLPAALAEACKAIPFRKSMRWSDGDATFGRPVQWLVALLGAEVVPVSFAGVEAGRSSRGHRFLAPEPFELARADDYVDALRRAHVLVEPAERKARMREQLLARAAEAGGVLVEDAFLETENASMVEEPHVLLGAFDPAFLELPDDVTIEVMRGHQRYFALRSADGALLPRYLVVSNHRGDPAQIVRGNDRVLRARLADARFFVLEDRKVGLADRAEGLGGVVFQNQLGSVADRVERIVRVVRGLGDDGAAEQAGRLCKADLLTLIVGEFPELQGVMGRWYALAEGLPEEVADAIRDHYLPRGAGDAVPEAAPAARLAVADRADVLVGCFGIGLTPTGSADPFALRRACLGLVRIALEGPIDVDVRAVLGDAWEAYAGQGKPVKGKKEVLEELDGFVRGRLAAWYGERYDGDLVAACLGAWPGSSLRDLGARMEALAAFRKLPAYGDLAVAFKRAFNIAKDSPDADAPDPALFAEAAEKALWEAFASLRPRVEAAAADGAYGDALDAVAEVLRAPIDRYFDEVFVMVEDPAVRGNRLRTLRAISDTLTALAHFHLLSSPSDGG
jgi:glycyl-tRNA synthetase beta chain